jgi:hypothetical protein
MSIAPINTAAIIVTTFLPPPKLRLFAPPVNGKLLLLLEAVELDSEIVEVVLEDSTVPGDIVEDDIDGTDEGCVDEPEVSAVDRLWVGDTEEATEVARDKNSLEDVLEGTAVEGWVEALTVELVEDADAVERDANEEDGEDAEEGEIEEDALKDDVEDAGAAEEDEDDEDDEEIKVEEVVDVEIEDEEVLTPIKLGDELEFGGTALWVVTLGAADVVADPDPLISDCGGPTPVETLTMLVEALWAAVLAQ